MVQAYTYMQYVRIYEVVPVGELGLVSPLFTFNLLNLN